jgi:hypothetical protein
MKKYVNNNLKSCNINNEITKIEYLKQDFNIKAIQYKNKDTLEIYFKKLHHKCMIYTLECIGIYQNMSTKTFNKILKLCDEVEYRRF